MITPPRSPKLLRDKQQGETPLPSVPEEAFEGKQTDRLAVVPTDMGRVTRSLREPVIIRGSGRKVAKTTPPSPRRRLIVHASVAVFCVIILLGSLLAVLPAGNGQAQGLAGLFAPFFHMTTTKSSNTALIAAQAATATAVAQYDGYDPGNNGSTYANGTNTGGNTSNISASASDAAHLSRFYYGQCTYWANYEYHRLTGVWVSWLGNAYEWYYQAIAAGWNVSTSPNPNGPSIIVLGPYAQDSLTAYGHVGVVEGPGSIGNGTVITTDMHWPIIGVVSDVTFKFPAAGTHFIWAPGH